MLRNSIATIFCLKVLGKCVPKSRNENVDLHGSTAVSNNDGVICRTVPRLIIALLWLHKL